MYQKVKFVFLSLFVAATFTLSAQSLKWSQPLQDDNKWPFMKILASDEQGYFVLRSNLSLSSDRSRIGFKSRKFELDYYADDLRLLHAFPVVAPCNDCRIADIGMVGDQPAILYSQFTKQTKTLQFFLQKLDKNGAFAGNKVQLLELSAEKYDDDEQPDLIFSQDERLIGCAVRSLDKKKDEQKYSIVVFDSSTTVLYRKEIPVPIKASRFSVSKMLITDSGNFYLLGTEYTTDRRIRNPGEIFYKLISYNLQSDAITMPDIKLEDKFLTDVSMTVDNLNNKIILAGFYSDLNTYSSAGVFYYSIRQDSLSSSNTPVVSSPFPDEFLKKNFLNRSSKNRSELSNFSIDKVVVRKDAGAAIIAEAQYIYTQSYWDPYMRTWIYRYYYYYGNIISVSINPDGTLLWNNVVNKEQNSVDDGGYYSSYYPFIVKGKIRLLYNRYLKIPTSVLLTSIKGTGEQTTDVLIGDSENVIIVPGNAKQVDEETILVPAYKDTKPYLLKITF